MGARAVLQALFTIGLLWELGGASASDHRFKQGEEIELFANKVGPFSNPT
jgi:hypothetical protein